MSLYPVTRANSLVLAGLLGILALVGGVTWERYDAAEQARTWTRHTYEVLDATKDLIVALRDVETGRSGYILTGQDDDLKPYARAIDQVTLREAELQRMTADNPAQQARLRTLAPLVARKLEEVAQTIQLRRDQGQQAALRVIGAGAGRAAAREIEATLASITAEERRLLGEREATAERRGQVLGWLVAAGAFVSIAGLLVAAGMLNRAWTRSTAAETEQRATALRLRTSLDSLSQGIGVFDADRALTHWNECFQVLLGLPRPMVRRGTPYAAIADHARDAAMPLETEDQILHGATQPGEATTYERIRTDGHSLEIRRTSMPDGGFVLTISDMTKRAEAEQVLRESQKMQAIGQLTGGIAHDFNNLLTIILGNLETVQKRLGDDNPLQGRIERSVWAANRGATLTSQLLAFARKQPLAPTPIDLAATMPDLVPLLRRTLGEHIEVRYVENAGLWPAMADQAQLESALLNLALNARDAMPDGGRLTIELANKVIDREYARAHVEVQAGDYTMLAVSDTGHGMTPDIVARVFEPFFTTKPTGKGTGLGLAMVFGFVKQSAGHVKIYSEPGHGTTVRLYLPRALGGIAAPRQSDPIDLPRGTATILVVEDEPAVREVAVAALRDLGYRVLEAADGDEALRVFGAHAASVALLLTDVVLPGPLRGRELAERIVAIRPEVRILYMSGYTENSIVHHGRLDDGVQLLGKPFRREQLARKVAEVLGPAIHASAPTNVIPLKSRSPE